MVFCYLDITTLYIVYHETLRNNFHVRYILKDVRF